MNELRKRALELYKGPFKFDRCGGHIWDANQLMVSDDRVENGAIHRVRGWGRIQKLPYAEALQDEVGEMIAQAMTEFWEREVAKEGGSK